MKQLLHGMRRAALPLPLAALAAPCAAFLLSAAALGGQFSPWALAAVAVAGTGWNGAAAGLGALLGALAFLDFQPGLRHGAAALLIVLAVGIYFLADSLAGKNGQNEQKEKIRA